MKIEQDYCIETTIKLNLLFGIIGCLKAVASLNISNLIFQEEGLSMKYIAELMIAGASCVASVVFINRALDDYYFHYVDHHDI
jgi:hypothetical protein